jgi:hypothetical protein
MGDTLTESTSFQCTHGASTSFTASQQRVKVNGSAVLTVSDMGSVSGCPFQIPVGVGTKPMPCVTAMWVKPDVRVRAGGQPVVSSDSVALGFSAEQAPLGPVQAIATQSRVRSQ